MLFVSSALPVLSGEKRRRGYHEDYPCVSPSQSPVQSIFVDGKHRPTGLRIPPPVHSGFRTGGPAAVCSGLTAHTQPLAGSGLLLPSVE